MKFINNPYAILIITIVNIFLFVISYAKFGMFFIDTSREAYIPMMMNKGSILYHDIFNVYPPLGYQINALCYKFFGENLRTLYFAGFINSLLFIYGFYFLADLFFKQNKNISLMISLLVTVCCIYPVSLVNFIFPYSYSLVYSLSAFIFSLLFLLKYINYKNNKFLILSYFFFGICISFKYEYILFSIILILIPFIYKENYKVKLLCFSAFLSVPLISLLSLFIDGNTINDLKSALNYMFLLSKSEKVKVCYEFLGLIPSYTSLKQTVIYFIKTITGICVLYFCFFKIKKSLLIPFSAVIIYLISNLFYVSNSFYFNWIGLFSLFILFIYVIFLIKRKKLRKKDTIYIIFAMAVNLSAMKSIFSVNFNNYGTYFFPLLFLNIVVYIINYFPLYKHAVNKNKTVNFIVYVMIILTASFFISNIQRRNYAFSAPVKTKRGTIFVEPQKGNAINSMIKYIENETAPDSEILVLPEGAMINFLTNRKSNNKFYYLIPPNIEIFNETQIKKELENNLPDYLIIQPMSYNNFKETYFCESFGAEICSIIPKYYERPIIFGENFWLAIYKKK